MPVHFITPGHIDLNAITMMGINHKTNDNPIGYFGTGLKYALATCMRSGFKVQIFRGAEAVSFEKELLKFREKNFEAIVMKIAPNHVEKLAYTTELGKNWETWMAFREFHSNTLDEGGETKYYATEEESVQAVAEFVNGDNQDRTLIVVRGEKFDATYHDRDLIFCTSKVLYSDDAIEIRAGRSKYMFYRGVRVFTLPKVSNYTYNLKRSIDLTEDRTVKHQHYVPFRLGEALLGVTDSDILIKVLCSGDRSYENDVHWSDGHTASDQFIEALMALTDNGNLVPSVRRWAKKNGHLSVEEVETTPVQLKMIERAKTFLEATLGLDFTRYPIRVVKLHGALGQAKDNQILLDPAIFEKGTKYVAHGLYEEYTHLDTGYDDETRELQTHLFQRILSMAEDKYGEPV